MRSIKLFLSFFILVITGFTTFGQSDSTISNSDFIPIGISSTKEDSAKTTLIYELDIFENISANVWRNTQGAFKEAKELKADLFLIHMNTYGGLVVSADSIRTAILNSDIPVWVFVDNNAASAGALISISCDKIFIRTGGSIGAATVVSQNGEAMPDKYQSYMRATMRATAEAHGKDTIIQGNDTIIQWKRDPYIAEAMVDPDCYIPGIIDSTKVLTFTPNEASKHGYCNGIYETKAELLSDQGITDYETKKFEPTAMDKIMGFLTNPAFKGFLIMFIIGGLYFELQSPGIGFPLIIALAAATVYFAPSYIEGLASNWEIILFIVGVIFIALEIFVVPGFGVTGIIGIALIIAGLALSMIGKYEIQPIEGTFNFYPLIKALAIVIVTTFLSFILSIWFSSKIFSDNNIFGNLSLNTTQENKKGYVSVDLSEKELVGKVGIAVSDLRPSGKIEIDNKHYDAFAIIGYIERNTKIIVKRFETGQLYVEVFKEN